MEFFRPDARFDFMRYRKVAFTVSTLMVLASLVGLVYPGPNYGVDFRGGTELQLRFRGQVSPAELRQTLEKLGYQRPDVVSVEGKANEYIVRVREVSSLPASQVRSIQTQLRQQLAANPGMPLKFHTFKVSPGGDKLSLRLSAPLEPEALQVILERSGARLRGVSRFGNPGDYRYEAQLIGISEALVSKLDKALGARGPDAPRRVEWVGPKAGEQLREAAIKSFLYAIVFIMVYVAFRFDLRFAPGGILALLHDAIVTLGVLVLLRKEVNLTTVAAILTIVGYSINDTIVIYDRIRENMARLRTASLREIINISTSQTMSRTIITSGVTMLSITAFLIWGTSTIRDFALTLIIGMIAGTYSTIYIASPVTEWIDTRFFRKQRS